MDKPWCYSQTETATRNPLEPPADIIVKGGREVEYGRKLNLTTGRSGLILDLVIEAGNPADRERFSCELSRFSRRPEPPQPPD
jgi:IS5 family transposase